MFADNIIYFFRSFLAALRLTYEYRFDDEECKEIKRLRKRLIVTSLKKGRLFLAFYIIVLTYPPVFYLFNIRWVRRHFFILEGIGKKIANCLEIIHL